VMVFVNRQMALKAPRSQPSQSPTVNVWCGMGVVTRLRE
jgi:hypothetical protein